MVCELIWVMLLGVVMMRLIGIVKFSVFFELCIVCMMLIIWLLEFISGLLLLFFEIGVEKCCYFQCLFFFFGVFEVQLFLCIMMFLLSVLFMVYIVLLSFGFFWVWSVVGFWGDCVSVKMMKFWLNDFLMIWLSGQMLLVVLCRIGVCFGLLMVVDSICIVVMQWFELIENVVLIEMYLFDWS